MDSHEIKIKFYCLQIAKVLFQTRNKICKNKSENYMWTKFTSHISDIYLSVMDVFKKCRSIRSISYFCLKKAKFRHSINLEIITRGFHSSIHFRRWNFHPQKLFCPQAPLNFRVSRDWTCHRIELELLRGSTHPGEARRKSDEPVRSRGLKGVRVTSRQSPELFEPLLFIGSISLFPVQPLPFSLFSLSLSPFLALVPPISDRFHLLALLNRGKVPAEKAPQPLTDDARGKRKREKSRKRWSRWLSKADGKKQTSPRHTKRR